MWSRGDEKPGPENEALFGAVFQAAAIGIALVDLNGRPVQVNPVLERFLGYGADELRTMTLADLTHPADVDRDRALADELFAGTRDAYHIEKRYVRRDGTVVWGRMSSSLIRDREGRPRYALRMVEDVNDRVRLESRRGALQRIARRLACEPDSHDVMQTLLEEAVGLTGGAFGIVARWDEPRGVLTPVWHTLPLPTAPVDIKPGIGVGGEAFQRRAAIIENDYGMFENRVTTVADAGVRAAVAAPLLHEGRVLGVVVVASDQVGKQFLDIDAELLELLASLGSAVLVGQQHSRLEGVLLAARTAQHNLRNQLASVVGYCDMVLEDARLPEDVRELLQEAIAGAHGALEVVDQLQRVTHVEEANRAGPGGPVIDLARSVTVPT